jgi:aminoglycoside phosphotransferase (APT) family kinase protein
MVEEAGRGVPGGPDQPRRASVPGPERIESWLRTLEGFGSASVNDVEPLTDGLSNVTCRLALTSAPVAAAVLRIQPERGIFEPYDVLREGEVLRCLARTTVPVPGVLASEGNASFFGAPALLLEWVDAPHMPAPEVDPATFFADLAPFAAALAAIHGLDWRAAGLDFPGVLSSAAAGYVEEVGVVEERMKVFGCESEPLLVRALELLRASSPSDGRLALCQGDPNPFNYLFRDGRVVAVVDWEQARISDPRSDVAQLVALSHLRGAAPFGQVRENPFVQLYQAATGVPLEGLELFRALWLFQLGVVFHGWMAYGTEPWFAWAQIEDFLTQALAEL